MSDAATPAARPERIAPGRAARLSARVAQVAVAAIAIALLYGAAIMDQRWADWHMLDDILVARGWMRTILQVERLLMIIFAGLLLLRLPRIGRIANRAGWADVARRWGCIGGGILLALPASEGVLRLVAGRPTGQTWSPVREPLRRDDSLLGWTNIPMRHAVDRDFASRPVYDLDVHGYRVASQRQAVDRAAPSILFVGESIMFGKGLNWSRSMAGQVEAWSGIQSANLAVAAYSTSQTYLQLKRELPKFRRPVAVVILFGPSLMIRDLDRNRPWIDRAGQWHPGRGTWHLKRLQRVLFPYHSAAAIEEAVIADRQLLRAGVALARARGAEPLVLVPIFQPEPPQQRALRAAVLDQGGIPNIPVRLDPAWRLFPDAHPDARAHAAMAHAIWMRLKQRRGYYPELGGGVDHDALSTSGPLFYHGGSASCHHPGALSWD